MIYIDFLILTSYKDTPKDTLYELVYCWKIRQNRSAYHR